MKEILSSTWFFFSKYYIANQLFANIQIRILNFERIEESLGFTIGLRRNRVGDLR